MKRKVLRAFLVLSLAMGAPLGCSEDLHAPAAQIDLEAPTVAVGAQVSLDGSASSDRDGDALAYRWRLRGVPAGSHAVIGDASATRTWFVPDVAGDYEIELVVSDGILTSQPAIATLTAGPCGGNAPYIGSITADPGAPWAGQAVRVSAAVTDPDAQCGQGESLVYAWSLVELPSGSFATLNDGALAAPSLLTDQAGTYRVRLVVTDAAGHASAPFEAAIVASGCATTPGDVTNVIATPSDPATSDVVTLGAEITPRTSSGSSTTTNDAGLPADAGPSDGAPPPAPAPGPAGPPPSECPSPHYVYHWTLVGVPVGSSASLVDSPLETPSFTADVPGEYTVEVYVTTDDGIRGEAQRGTITVGDCGSHAPVVSSASAAPAAPAIGQSVLLSAAVTDADTGASCGRTEQLSYLWQLTRLPSGSTATLNDPSILEPSFTPDVAGTYEATLTVVDAAGHVGTAVTTVDATGDASCGTNAPSIVLATATPSSPNTGQSVGLGVLVTDPDTSSPCSLVERLTVAWRLTSVPVGSSAVLNDPNQVSPWFTPDLPGTYGVEVVASDAAGHASAPSSLTVVASTCGSAKPSISAITVAPTTPTVGAGTSLGATVTDADTAGGCGLTESFTYAWQLTAVPSGSVTTLTSSTSPVSGFVPDRSGTYTVRLVVTDAAGHVSNAFTRNVTVAAASTCGAATPRALLASFTPGPCLQVTCNAATITPSIASGPAATAPNHTISLNGRGSVRLDGSASSDTDNLAPCSLGQPLFYQWSILAAPRGSQAWWSIGTGPTTSLVAPTFNTDLAGIYQVQLLVSDGTHISRALVIQINR